MPDSHRSDAVTAPSPMSFGSEILVPLDVGARGERAAELGADLARTTDGALSLVSVIAAAEELDIRRSYLDQVASSLADRSGGPIRTEVRIWPSIGRSLASRVTDDTTVVMATAATMAPHQGHIGSIGESIVRASHRPTVLVGPNAMASLVTGPRRVVVPVDGSELSERALLPAVEVARWLAAPVWIVTVLTPDMEGAAAGMGIDPAAETGYVRRLAAELPEDIDAEFEVLHRRDIAEAILEFAGEDGVCVMSSHGRSGVARLALGSVTAQVVRHARWPAVVIPPA